MKYANKSQISSENLFPLNWEMAANLQSMGHTDKQDSSWGDEQDAPMQMPEEESLTPGHPHQPSGTSLL